MIPGSQEMEAGRSQQIWGQPGLPDTLSQKKNKQNPGRHSPHWPWCPCKGPSGQPGCLVPRGVTILPLKQGRDWKTSLASGSTGPRAGGRGRSCRAENLDHGISLSTTRPPGSCWVPVPNRVWLLGDSRVRRERSTAHDCNQCLLSLKTEASVLTEHYGHSIRVGVGAVHCPPLVPQGNRGHHSVSGARSAGHTLQSFLPL